MTKADVAVDPRPQVALHTAEADGWMPIELHEDCVGKTCGWGSDIAAHLYVTLDHSVADGRLRVTLENRGESTVEACLRVLVALPSTDPWFMIPGLFYGENRPADCDRIFPRFDVGADDPAAMISHAWSFRSDRAATPAVFVWSEEAGVALVTRHVSALGPTGVGFSHQENLARIHLDFPYRESPISYYGDATPRPPMVAAHTFTPGQQHEMEFELHLLPPSRHSHAPILRSVWERSEAERSVGWMTPGQAAHLSAEGLLRWHYDPDPGVLLETAGFDREVTVAGRHVDRQAMHVGWVSGLPWAHALLMHGLRTGWTDAVGAAESIIDFVTANLSPSGTLWGVWYRDVGWTQSWTPTPCGLHARTLGEATHFLVRSLTAVGSRHPRHAAWMAAARSNLDAVARRQRPDGNLGAMHHAGSGDVLSWHGAAGLAWIPAFVEATESGVGDYAATAERAGAYYASFVERGFINGAPEDVDLAPTSEDGYAAVMAYVALHRASGDDHWLRLAVMAADWMLTFRYTYDVDFPEHTLLARYGFSTRGADQASPSNQHLASYGLICTSELFALTRATGDDHYRRRALETLECFRQFIARTDGDFNAYRGMVTERYYHTECFQPPGMILTLSHAWSVGVALLGHEQLIEDASHSAGGPPGAATVSGNH